MGLGQGGGRSGERKAGLVSARVKGQEDDSCKSFKARCCGLCVCV